MQGSNKILKAEYKIWKLILECKIRNERTYRYDFIFKSPKFSLHDKVLTDEINGYGVIFKQYTVSRYQ